MQRRFLHLLRLTLPTRVEIKLRLAFFCVPPVKDLGKVLCNSTITEKDDDVNETMTCCRCHFSIGEEFSTERNYVCTCIPNIREMGSKRVKIHSKWQ